MSKNGSVPFLHNFVLRSSLLILLFSSTALADPLSLLSGPSTAAYGDAQFTPICAGGVAGDGSGEVCDPPASVHIECPNGVTIACDGQNVLTPDCVMHLPEDACNLRGIEPGVLVPVKDLRRILRDLRDLYDDITSYAEGLVVCISAHETMHGIHASRQTGGPLLACDSETGAYDEEMRCWAEALKHCTSQSDCEAIARHLEFATSARNYNQCLCAVHPDRWQDNYSVSGQNDANSDWPSMCAMCEDATGYDDQGGNYCTANDPSNPWIIG
ncbi:MAG: hypothetical protein KDD66_06435 [Bdellovibrionales bacterium]|nr:hypothetical protein [Bdellovibrionales bacterium]